MYAKLIISTILALLLVLWSLFYVEHPSIRGIVESIGKAGFIDTIEVINSVNDLKSNDHIRGNLDSDVIVIEYSDYYCSICAFVQKHLKKLLQEEDILLVYRHLYGKTISKGFERAVIAECVARNVSEEEFFKFSDYLYNNQLQINLKDVQLKAIETGVLSATLDKCEKDKSIKEHIRNQAADARKLGAQGTPFIVFIKNGQPRGISYGNDFPELRKLFKKAIKD